MRNPLVRRRRITVPPGYAERAIVEVSDKSRTYSILLDGGTGQVKVHDGEYDRVEEFLGRDAEGQEVAR